MSSSAPVSLLIRGAAAAVADTFRGFGLINALPSLGFDDVSGAEEAGGAGSGLQSREATLAPVLDVLASFRERVRDAARAGDAGAVLQLCDAMRDEALAPLGVRFEDVSGGAAKADGASWAPTASRWKLVSAEDLMREADDKARATAEKAARKAEVAAEAARKAFEKAEKAKIDPRKMFTNDPAYSAFDADGVPTHDAAGAEIAKSKVKNLKKEWQVQERLWAWGQAQPHANDAQPAA
jgi:cysteinyl-tRNA synthetase